MQEAWCHDQKLSQVVGIESKNSMCMDGTVQTLTPMCLEWNSLLLSGVLLCGQGH